MKKRILGVALGAAILFTSNLISVESAIAQDSDEISTDKPKIKCPSGDILFCTKFLGGTVWRGDSFPGIVDE